MLTQVAGLRPVEAAPFRAATLPPENITERQRERIRKLLEQHQLLLQHRVALVVADAEGPDPESALASVSALSRECEAILARARRILR